MFGSWLWAQRGSTWVARKSADLLGWSLRGSTWVLRPSWKSIDPPECLNAQLGACELRDVGLCVKLCLLTDCVWACLIGRWRRCCCWQEVFSLFSTWPAKRGGPFPTSALVRMEFWRQWWSYESTHYATGALTLHAAQGARVIVEANICIITCLILVPSGISSNFVHSSFQRHKHTHRRCKSQLLRICIQTLKTQTWAPTVMALSSTEHFLNQNKSCIFSKVYGAIVALCRMQLILKVSQVWLERQKLNLMTSNLL